MMSFFFAINHIKIIKVSKSKGGEDNDEDGGKVAGGRCLFRRGWSPQGVASRRAAPKKALVPMHARSSVVKVSSGVQ